MAPPPIPAPRASGFTTTTAHPLYWCAYGAPSSAGPVVVLHGGPGAHHEYLLPQLLALADEFELLFYDQRGGGRSRTDDPAPIGWRTHVDDLRAFLDERGVVAPRLLGYSWGGLLAMLYAIEAARDAAWPAPRALALVDPAPVTRTWRDAFEREFAARARGPVIAAMRAELDASGLRERDPAAHRQRSFELSVAGYFADPRRAADLTPFRVTGRVQQQVWASLGAYDLTHALAAVRVPSAIVVHGRQDPIPLASSRAAAEALGAPLVVLEDCGHVPYVEQPAALFAALRPALRLLPASA